MTKHLVMMIGYPNTGKTTLARRMGHPVIMLDELRRQLHGHRRVVPSSQAMTLELAKMMARVLFKSHDTVVVDYLNHNREHRDPWADPAWQRFFHITGGPECLAADQQHLADLWQPVEADEHMKPWPIHVDTHQVHQ